MRQIICAFLAFVASCECGGDCDSDSTIVSFTADPPTSTLQGKLRPKNFHGTLDLSCPTSRNVYVRCTASGFVLETPYSLGEMHVIVSAGAGAFTGTVTPSYLETELDG